MTTEVGYKKLVKGLITLGLDVDELKYAGNHAEMKKYYHSFTGRSEFPAHKHHCVCGVRITHQHYLYDPTADRVAVLGSDCIKNFFPDIWDNYKMLAGKTCPDCHDPKRTAKSKYCTKCRGPRMKDDNEWLGRSPYEKKHQGKWFRDIFDVDPTYIWWCPKKNGYRTIAKWMSSKMT